MSSQKTYEKVLVERGFITSRQLEKVLQTQQKLGGKLEELLLSLELLTAEEAKSIRSLVAQVEAQAPAKGGLPKLPSSSSAASGGLPKSLTQDSPALGGLPKLPSATGGLPKLPSATGGLPKLPSTSGGLPKLPQVSASAAAMAPVAPVALEEERLTTPSGSEHPQLSNPRVQEAMSALEKAQFDQSFAETMAPGGPLDDPLKDDTSGGAGSLREAQEGAGPTTQPASQQVRQALPTLRTDGTCHVCNTKQSEEGAKLCEKCFAFLGKPAANDKLLGLLLGGRFLLNGRLGAGGMGLVYHATDQETEGFVACKILPIQLSTDEQTIQRFHLEAKVMLDLDHPHIVRAIDYGFEDEVGCYLAMELLVGEELKDFLKRQKMLSPQEIKTLYSQLCDAMSYAHETGVVHRDLKPSNIFLMKSEQGPLSHAKVIDFGIARLTADDMPRHTVTGTFLGTPQYMSPEQAGASGKLDHRSDVYTMGIILYELLTGRLPFVGNHIAQVLMNQIYMPPPALALTRPEVTYPPAIQSYIERVLAKEPDKRPDSMQQMKQELFAIIDSLPGNKWGDEALIATVDDPMVEEKLVKAANTLLSRAELPTFEGKVSAQELFEELARVLRQPRGVPASTIGAVDEVPVLMLSEVVEEEEPVAVPVAPVEPPSGAVVARIATVKRAVSADGTPLSSGSMDALPTAPMQKTTSGSRIMTRNRDASPKARPGQRKEQELRAAQQRKFLFMLVFALLFFSLLLLPLLNR